MGFALTVLYLITTFLGADTVFGSLAVYRVELIIAILILLVSIPSILKSFLLKTPQSWALFGLALAVFLSILATGWVGGAVQAFQMFIPNAFAYFLVCLHCNSRGKLKFIVVLLLFVCLFVIVQGSIELRNIVPQNRYDESSTISGGVWSGTYLMGMQNDSLHWFFRLRGKGFINDPNDFAQLIVSVIPLVFVFWRRKKKFWNLICVICPVCALLYGAFLTHSRGFLLAFLGMAVVAGRRRIGTVPSLIIASGMFVAASVLNFTGGRGVSLEAGSGRMALWGGGLGMLKSHPLFGVGFGRLPEYLDGFTAHNSIAVCAGELGLCGLFFWSLFLFPTLRGAWLMASTPRLKEREALFQEDSFNQKPATMPNEIDASEMRRKGQLLVLSLTGFLVAGLFLSRAFVMTLFLLGGMEEVVYEVGLQRGILPPRLRMDRALLFGGALAVSMVLGLYIMLKISMH